MNHRVPARALAIAILATDLPAWAFEWNGFADQRLEHAQTRARSLVPTADFPEDQATTEINFKFESKDAPHLTLKSDVSLLGRAAEHFRATDADGYPLATKPSGLARRKLWANVAEAYAALSASEKWSFILGKKRVVWGSGFAANPTDLLNPPKDPLEPSSERAGAWLLGTELITNAATVTALLVPQVQEDDRGIWERGLRFRAADTGAEEDRYLAALRLYTLIADTDINLMAFFSKKFDGFATKLRPALSASKFVTQALEFHAEVLLTEGSARLLPTACTESMTTMAACRRSGEPLVTPAKIHSHKVYPHALLGTRYAFANESELSLEYLYLADGFSAQEFAGFTNLVAAGGAPLSSLGSVSSNGQPVAGKLRRHYLTLGHQRYQFLDDIYLSTNGLINADDGSGLIQASLLWQATETIHLTLAGLKTLEWDPRRGVQTMARSERVSESDLSPQEYRLTAAIRAYF